MKRVNIQIPEELHTKAKILSVLQGTTLNDYLAAAIEAQVKKEEGLLGKLGDKTKLGESAKLGESTSLRETTKGGRK